MIRVATLEDLPLVTEFGKKFISEASLGNVTDLSKCEEMAKLFILSPKKEKIILLYEDIGMIAGGISPMLFSNLLVATEMMWWVNKGERSKEIGSILLNAFEYWAKEAGANMINMNCFDDRVGKFYEKNGYSLRERIYFKDL